MDLQNQNHVGHQCSDYELEPRSADYHAVSQEEILQDDADAVSPLEEPLEAVTHAIIEQQEQESLQTGTHTVSQQQDVIRDDMDGPPNPEYAPIDTLQSVFYGDFSGCGPDDDHLMCAVNNVAKAMTKTFRDSAYIAYGLEGANATLGETLATVSYVRVDWQWASLPFCVWVMAAALWCGTALKTRRANVPVWANNVLPLLFLYGKDSADESEIVYDTLSSDYLRRTEKINAQLQVADGKAVLNCE